MNAPTRERAGRFFAYGICASIALHLAFAPLVRRAPAYSEESTQPLVVERLPRAATPRPTPRETPTPKPRSAVSPPRRPRVTRERPRIRAPHQERSSRGAAHQVPNPYLRGAPAGEPHSAGDVIDASPAPVPAAVTASLPTPTPLVCARPDVPAATIRAVEPEIPALAQQQNVSGTVDVVVSLDASSRIVATRIASSPSSLLDAAALGAARSSEFRTEVRACRPVAAEYLFRVDFATQ